MSLVVDNPVINSPFEEPAPSWDFEEGRLTLVNHPRPAGCYPRPGTQGPQLSILGFTPAGIKSKELGPFGERFWSLEPLSIDPVISVMPFVLHPADVGTSIQYLETWAEEMRMGGIRQKGEEDVGR